METMTPVLAVAKMEGGRMLQSRRGLLWLTAYSAVLSAFALLLVSNTELSLLDNAQVVYMMAGAITAAGAMLSVILGCDAFAGEKERGTLVPLLCTPIKRDGLLMGKALGLLLNWVAMYVLALPYLWAVGASGQNLGPALLYLALFGTFVVLGFGYLAMYLSARTGSVMASLLGSLMILFLAASPLVIGPGLRASAVGRILDAVNPFAGALNTFDSVIIDSEPFTHQAGRLALVTLWLAITFLAARRGAGNPKF